MDGSHFDNTSGDSCEEDSEIWNVYQYVYTRIPDPSQALRLAPNINYLEYLLLWTINFDSEQISGNPSKLQGWDGERQWGRKVEKAEKLQVSGHSLTYLSCIISKS
jgi:hypothetical protein